MLVVKNLPATAGGVRDANTIPGLGRSSGEGHHNLLQYSWLENPTVKASQRVGYNWVTKLTDTQTHTRTVTKLCPTLCSFMNCSPPGSSVHGTFQARILKWVAISSSRGSSWSRDRTCISSVSWIAKEILHYWAVWESYFPLQEVGFRAISDAMSFPSLWVTEVLLLLQLDCQ